MAPMKLLISTLQWNADFHENHDRTNLDQTLMMIMPFFMNTDPIQNKIMNHDDHENLRSTKLLRMPFS
jgi:hypothetical protein